MSEFLTKTLLTLSEWAKMLGGFNLSKSSFGTDALVAVFFMVVILLIAFGVGKTRMLLAILSTYIAFLVTLFFPFYAVIKTKADFIPEVFWPQVAVFFVIFSMAFYVLNKSVLRSKMSLKESSPLIILWLSMVETGFLASIVFSYGVPEWPTFKISPWLATYFGTSLAHFVWSVLPLLSILLVKPGRRSASSNQ